MKAAVFLGAGSIEVRDVPDPVAEAGEVVIRVGYCGICGSDLEAYATGMYETGLIIGHEFAGTIVQIGPGVSGWQVGDRVVVSDAVPCGECPSCREGRLDACESLTMIGVTHDGGMASTSSSRPAASAACRQKSPSVRAPWLSRCRSRCTVCGGRASSWVMWL